MNSLSRKAWLLLVFVSINGAAVADNSDQAREWLERMTSAMSKMSYQGTFVYVRSGDVETMRITHVNDDAGVRERMYSISGPRREVIRNRDGVRCLLQDSGSVVADSAIANPYFSELPLAAIDKPEAAYQLEMSGKARIAGQMTRRISIEPKDEFRYGYEFWLAEHTGLLLKWVLKDSDRKVLAKLMFTEFTTGSDVDERELESDSPVDQFIELPTFNTAGAVVTEGNPGWQPGNLPTGFKLTSHMRHLSPDGVFEHLVYSDGLAAVSVYIEKHGSEIGVLHGVSQLGTNNAYSRQQGELQITAIGEVPALTVKTIANSMTRSIVSN